MKSIVLIAAYLSIATTSFSQFTKGDKFLGGSFSVQTENVSNNSVSGSINDFNIYSFNPSIGFFTNEKSTFGLRLGYSSLTFKNYVPGDFLSERNETSLFAGLMLRRYFLLSEKFFFLIEGSLGYSKGNDTYNYFDYSNGLINKNETKTDGFSIGLIPKFVFFPSPKWGIEAGIGSVSYSNTSTSNSNASTSRFNLNYGVFTLGFAYYIRKQN